MNQVVTKTVMMTVTLITTLWRVLQLFIGLTETSVIRVTPSIRSPQYMYKHLDVCHVHVHVYPGLVGFFWTKNWRTFQGLSRTNFAFCKDYLQCKKRALIPYLFLVLPHQENFIPKVFVFALFPLQFSLHYLVGIEIQGLSRPWIFILKFKDFRRFSRCMHVNPVYHRPQAPKKLKPPGCL